jgi:hypothetical protein
MSFESGSISVRAYVDPRRWPEDALERLAAHSAPPLKGLGRDEANGWVGGRHLLDTPVTEENAIWASYLRVTLLKAERKIPPALFKAECMMEELAWMRAEDKTTVDRETRRRIRRMVTERLQPQMPPTLRGIPLVRDPAAGLLYTGALSDAQHDAFVATLRGTLGVEGIPVNFDTLAAQRAQVLVRTWGPASFTPEIEDGDLPASPAEDFLTWLWYASEAEGGLFELKDEGTVGVALDGPLLFALEGERAAQEAVLRKGTPLSSAEARTALLAGVSFRRARLTLGQQSRSWTASFDAAQFVFRGLKLTEPEERIDAASLFQHRIIELGAFFRILGALVERFVRLRDAPETWSALQPKIRQWAKTRKTRA